VANAQSEGIVVVVVVVVVVWVCVGQPFSRRVATTQSFCGGPIINKSFSIGIVIMNLHSLFAYYIENLLYRRTSKEPLP
jgi:hypothetical protein